MFEILNRLVLPDTWQAEAIQHARSGRDVVLDAPTGAGKTFVVEKLVDSGTYSRQVIYTAPTRALANDKFAEWKRKGWRVGITTGDLTLDPDSPVLVGTLEAVQRRALDAPPDLLVLDEYQWLAHPERGNHYEGLLMALPTRVRLLLLSGSVANPGEVTAWLRRLGRAAETVSHRERPVPLEEVDGDALAKRVPSGIEGFWARCLTGALRDDLGPVLVFAPHRKDAEKIARGLARELPPCTPLELSPDQLALAGTDLARVLSQRVAWHHSGMTYTQRAGLVEPLAKAGQLRAVVSTLGLGSGINFSLRSVLITQGTYHQDGVPRDIPPQDILQMAGRAGRRGKDEIGYFIATRNAPRLGQGRAMPLKRAPALPWAVLLRSIGSADDPRQESLRWAGRFFAREPLRLGCEQTLGDDPSQLPCRLATDTARARLVRRSKRPFKPCRTCPQRSQCLQLPPGPTLLWQWTRAGLLNKSLRLTPRGAIVSSFLGPEGLALAAIVEDPNYEPAEAILDLINLFAGDRFAGAEPRWAGPLARSCQKIYGNLQIDGYLESGVPPTYGFGACQILRDLLNRQQRKAQLAGEHAGVGDIDRLLIEWRSLLRQILAAPPVELPRWNELREQAGHWLELSPAPPPVELPPLTASQTGPVNHRIRWG
ncbi:MAG: DEAD/DEAH box helicase [Candidatus Methylacidiphilales bacterium]|nr:DEAD/DEAH box helicase [Candidatus Methylacidiphilales bacterium]